MAGPENKTKPKGRAQQSHSLGAILFGGDVGDVGLRGRNVSAGNAVQDPSQKEHPERRCKTENEKADSRADNGNEQHRPPAILVRQPSQNRRKHQLHN